VYIGGTDTATFDLDVDVIWSELLRFELQRRSARSSEEKVSISNRLAHLLLLESSPVFLAVDHETLECVWVAHIARAVCFQKWPFWQEIETITVQTSLQVNFQFWNSLGTKYVKWCNRCDLILGGICLDSEYALLSYRPADDDIGKEVNLVIVPGTAIEANHGSYG
jgi:hypothetical protein